MARALLLVIVALVFAPAAHGQTAAPPAPPPCRQVGDVASMDGVRDGDCIDGRVTIAP